MECVLHSLGNPALDLDYLYDLHKGKQRHEKAGWVCEHQGDHKNDKENSIFFVCHGKLNNLELYFSIYLVPG